MQVNFLSQMRLTHKGDGPKVAKRLIDVYFALFKVIMNCFCFSMYLSSIILMIAVPNTQNHCIFNLMTFLDVADEETSAY